MSGQLNSARRYEVSRGDQYLVENGVAFKASYTRCTALHSRTELRGRELGTVSSL